MPSINYERLDYKKLTKDLLDVVQSSDPDKLRQSLTDDKGSLKTIVMMIEDQKNAFVELHATLDERQYDSKPTEDLRKLFEEIKALTQIQGSFDKLSKDLSDPSKSPKDKKLAIEDFKENIQGSAQEKQKENPKTISWTQKINEFFKQLFKPKETISSPSLEQRQETLQNILLDLVTKHEDTKQKIETEKYSQKQATLFESQEAERKANNKKTPLEEKLEKLTKADINEAQKDIKTIASKPQQAIPTTKKPLPDNIATDPELVKAKKLLEGRQKDNHAKKVEAMKPVTAELKSRIAAKKEGKSLNR